MGELPRFTGVTLALTEQHNLRSPYCYVVGAPGARISPQVAICHSDDADHAPGAEGRQVTGFSKLNVAG
jgi:hypothetical protein